MKGKLFAAGLAVVALGAGSVLSKRPPEQRTQTPAVEELRAAVPMESRPSALPLLAETAVSDPLPAAEETPTPPANPPTPERPARIKPPPAPAPTQPARPPKEERKDPVARIAMTLVGVDPYAEEYWLEAINDPTLSENEREDLIEDLNENGYSGGNGSQATPDDLWLIVRRIQIVEAFSPFAMDENNWNAFQEVYKDLWNMYGRLSQ